jgi:tetratricopeptide (TPR) repeat protein
MSAENSELANAILLSEVRDSTAKSFSECSIKPQKNFTDWTQHPRRRVIENFIVIWLDAGIDESDADCRNSIAHLRCIINSIYTFTDPDICVDFLTDVKDEKVFMIVSDQFGQQIVPFIEEINQLDSIYVFDDLKMKYELCTKEWSKVKGVFAQIESLCDSLQRKAQQHSKDLISISILSSTDVSNPDLDRLDPSFMYSQLLKQILLELEQDDDKAKKQFVEFCRAQYSDNEKTLQMIDKFEREYNFDSSIWWYTKEPFIYQILNRALRTQETDIIIKTGFFLRDLHRKIEHLHVNTLTNEKSMTVYRGQGMLKGEFEKMINSQGGLLSFNNFLSTSNDPGVSFMFAESAKDDPALTGVLFQMKVDHELASTPFVSVGTISNFSNHEEEVLFSMHTVFRIGEMKQVQDRLWQVELTLTNDNDQQLAHLTEYIREEIGGTTGWHRLGHLLIKIGEFDHAKEIYNILLDSISDNNQEGVAHIYHQLGYISNNKGDYLSALSLYHKTLEIQEKCLLSNHPDLATTYSNIGLVHQDLGNYSTALLFYQNALQIREKSLPSNHSDLAITHNNIGGIHLTMGDFSSALSSYQKTLDIQQRSLPANHPLLATTYSNIGIVHNSMGDYPSARLVYGKVLEIQQKSLPPNHPLLAITYNNIGGVYKSMGEYSSALLVYQKAFEIKQRSLGFNHPNLATTYNNIGEIHRTMGDYSSALIFYRKALEIDQKTLPPYHPSLAITYGNIGLVHQSMEDYSSALSSYQKTREIQEKSLPPHHSDLATTYNNIGGVYYSMEEYSFALSYYQKTLEIRQKYLPLNHPDLAIIYNNIGTVHRDMGDYSSALSFYQKTLEIQEKSLSPDYLTLCITHNNMATAFENLYQFDTSVKHYEIAVDIAHHTLGPNHPNTQIIRHNFDQMRKKMFDILLHGSSY